MATPKREMLIFPTHSGRIRFFWIFRQQSDDWFKQTAIGNAHLGLSLRTQNTPVPHGEPPFHGSTAKYCIPLCSRYVIASQPLPKVATLSTADNTFHIYGFCLNRMPIMGIRSRCQDGTLILAKWKTFSLTTFTIKVTDSDLHSSNRTNRQITVFFKRYAYTVYPLNAAYLYRKGVLKFSDVFNASTL